nr:hypothetical protein [Tanacetum cinerariifolium]
MRRVGKGFSGVETPLFEGMIVEQQVGEGVDEVHVDDVPADVSVVAKDVQDAEIEESSDVQGRKAESQAQIYQIDLKHANMVLSIAARKRKGVVIRDPKETATPSTIIHSEAKSKDKGKGVL